MGRRLWVVGRLQVLSKPQRIVAVVEGRRGGYADKYTQSLDYAQEGTGGDYESVDVPDERNRMAIGKL